MSQDQMNCRSHGLTMLTFALIASMILIAVVATNYAEATGHDCASAAADLRSELDELWSIQEVTGALPDQGQDTMFQYFPLLATLSWQAYQADGDVDFLQAATEATTRFVNFNLANFDSDGDYVLERSSTPEGHLADGVEDVGYNAMLALDINNLARMYAELGEAADALFWYQGSRTIARQLIQATYANEAGFFLPANDAKQRRESIYLATSILPAHFRRDLGDNIADSVLRNFLLKQQTLYPESPAQYLDWEIAPDPFTNGVPVHYLVRSALLLNLLESSGYEADAAAIRSRLAENIATRRSNATLFRGNGDRAYGDIFACMISGGTAELFPRYNDLTLLVALSQLNGVMDEAERTRLRDSAAIIRNYLSSTNYNGDLAAVETATRGIYLSISSLRAKWRSRMLFTPRDRGKIPGFDLSAAADNLFDDALLTAREAETRLSRDRAAVSGFSLTATLVDETAIPGEAVSVRIGLSAMVAPTGVRTITVTQDQRLDTLMTTATPLVLSPGDAARDYWHRYTPPNAIEGTIQPLRFSVEVQFADGKRTRYHFNRGVYISQPITFSLSYPQGRTLVGGQVPVELTIRKHVKRRFAVAAEWFSPAGLLLHEGRSFEMFMAEDVQQITVPMNVLVPTPCRPGAFPFLLKVFGNGDDKGTINANMFKHYQWIFVGPFQRKADAMTTVYPPEQTVDLRESYPGAIRPISWAALPIGAYRDNGELDLTALLPYESVGYMYTVIKTPRAKRTAITFYASAPAAIFVNGTRVAQFDRPTQTAPRRVTVSLQEGMNNILVKLLASDRKVMYFQLGDESDLTSDEFNNNLWELVDGYQDFYERSQTRFADQGNIQEIVTLSYTDPSANSVSVIGSFNGWSPVNSSMHRVGPGKWEISLHLRPGRYAYRFLVNNNRQILDPDASQREPDGYGGENSVVFVR